MQLVGQPCVHCHQRITRETGARVCSQCGSCVHDACAKRNAGGCRACGAPRSAKPRAAAPATKGKDRGYHLILLGVGLMIAAITGSTCAGALTGSGQFVIAGPALVGGVVLVLVGSVRNLKR